MTVFPSEASDEIIVDMHEDLISFNKEECIALIDECKSSYISKDNDLARNVIRKMIDFIGYTEIISK